MPESQADTVNMCSWVKHHTVGVGEPLCPPSGAHVTGHHALGNWAASLLWPEFLRCESSHLVHKMFLNTYCFTGAGRILDVSEIFLFPSTTVHFSKHGSHVTGNIQRDL